MTHTYSLYPGIVYLDDVPTTRTHCAIPSDHIRLCYVQPLTQVYDLPVYSGEHDITVYPIPFSLLTAPGEYNKYDRVNLPPEVVKDVKAGKTIVVFDGSGESTDILGSSFDSRVTEFMARHNLEDHTYNAIVNTCGHYELPPNSVIVTTGHSVDGEQDPHFTWCEMRMVEYVLNPANPEYIRQRLCQIDQKKPWRYPIISYNGRARGHKINLIKGLFSRNLVNKNLISCDSILTTDPDLEKQLPELGLPWRTADISDAQRPLNRNNLDHKLTELEAWSTHYNYYYSGQVQSEHLQSAVSLTTETWGHDVGLARNRFHHISEKSMRPLLMGMPFISWSQNYTLQYLQQCGYETYHGWWSEAYDKIPDPQEKTRLVLDTVAYITQLTESDITEMVWEQREVIEHNITWYNKLWTERYQARNLKKILSTWEFKP